MKVTILSLCRDKRKTKNSAKFCQDVKNKMRGQASERIRDDDMTTALHLGSRKIGNEGAKEIREKHA